MPKPDDVLLSSPSGSNDPSDYLTEIAELIEDVVGLGHEWLSCFDQAFQGSERTV